ncbi:MAG TPA: hypothetical protein VGP58_07190, partial [Pyrinomonadaceae bacterium]|nr:hypothetical protein [Pyrinomonadaceae bacterium]
MINKILSLVLIILMAVSLANAQTAEVSIALNEQFFDGLLDAIFKNFNAPEFPLAANSPKSKIQNPKSLVFGFEERNLAIQNPK